MRSAPAGRAVHLVVPAGIDDPACPSGGNTYDRRLADGLGTIGWSVRLHSVAGAWPEGDGEAHAALEDALRGLPDGSVVVVDGLVGSLAPAVLVPASRRLRLVVLAHMPFGQLGGSQSHDECAVLTAATAVVTISEWCRDWLLRAYPVDPATVHVAPPGVDPADPAPGGDGGNLLCVAAVTPGKGHDLLLEALARNADLDWCCSFVGTVNRAPEFVDRLRLRARTLGLADRVPVVGPRTGAELVASYAAADALVLASRAESYGMVVTEALAHGLPVLATEVGGLPEALGHAPDGRRPGILMRPDDVDSIASSLRRWLADRDVRHDLRAAALQRRIGLPGWPVTADRVGRVLDGVAR